MPYSFGLKDAVDVLPQSEIFSWLVQNVNKNNYASLEFHCGNQVFPVTNDIDSLDNAFMGSRYWKARGELYRCQDFLNEQAYYIFRIISGKHWLVFEYIEHANNGFEPLQSVVCLENELDALAFKLSFADFICSTRA